jgi:membrane associated rhomboid family serine protease
MFPISDTAPRASPVVVVITLTLIKTFVFLWMWSLPPRALLQVTFHYALVPLRYTDPVDEQAAGLDPNDWWPLLTNTFMHGGWLHLILNMWTLWIFGPAMEARFGRIGFTVFYPGGRNCRERDPPSCQS